MALFDDRAATVTLDAKNLTLNSEGNRMSDCWDSSLNITACLPPADMRPQGDPAETPLYVPQRHCCRAISQGLLWEESGL